MAVITRHPSQRILKALGLPKYTTEFSLTFKLGEIAYGTCSFHIMEQELDEFFELMTTEEKIVAKRLSRKMDGEECQL